MFFTRKMLENEGKISNEMKETEKLNDLRHKIDREGVNYIKEELQKNPNVYERSGSTRELSVYYRRLHCYSLILSVYIFYI